MSVTSTTYTRKQTRNQRHIARSARLLPAKPVPSKDSTVNGSNTHTKALAHLPALTSFPSSPASLTAMLTAGDGTPSSMAASDVEAASRGAAALAFLRRLASSASSCSRCFCNAGSSRTLLLDVLPICDDASFSAGFEPDASAGCTADSLPFAPPGRKPAPSSLSCAPGRCAGDLDGAVAAASCCFLRSSII